MASSPVNNKDIWFSLKRIMDRLGRLRELKEAILNLRKQSLKIKATHFGWKNTRLLLFQKISAIKRKFAEYHGETDDYMPKIEEVMDFDEMDEARHIVLGFREESSERSYSGYYNSSIESSDYEDDYSEGGEEDSIETVTTENSWKTVATENSWKTVATENSWKTVATENSWKTVATENSWETAATENSWETVTTEFMDVDEEEEEEETEIEIDGINKSIVIEKDSRFVPSHSTTKVLEDENSSAAHKKCADSSEEKILHHEKEESEEESEEDGEETDASEDDDVDEQDVEDEEELDEEVEEESEDEEELDEEDEEESKEEEEAEEDGDEEEANIEVEDDDIYKSSVFGQGRRFDIPDTSTAIPNDENCCTWSKNASKEQTWPSLSSPSSSSCSVVILTESEKEPEESKSEYFESLEDDSESLPRGKKRKFSEDQNDTCGDFIWCNIASPSGETSSEL